MLRLCVGAALAAFLMAGAETPGTLSVASEPAGASVYVDGQFVGETPLDVKNLQPGDHRVRLVKDGYLENGRVVNVSAGKTGSLQVRLTARNASDALPDGQAGGGISSGGGGGGSKKWLWIGLAGGGAAATAVALATRNHAPKLGAVTASPATGLMSASIITFNASASDDDGDSLTYTWDFGDGSSTATGNAPTHVYNAANTFTARVTVSDGKKDVSSTTSVAIRSLAGTWRGTLEGIAETFVFTQSTTTVGGTLSDAFGPGTVAGTVQTTSPRIRLTITQPPFNPFVYTGDPNADVNTLTGAVNGSGYNNVPMTLARQ